MSDRVAPNRQRTIDRQWIENHIPHQGLMCLLDRVERWDEQEIVCIALSHVHADNPLRNCEPLRNSGSLRNGGNLGIATAIEYAAQATAVHSALLIGDDGKLSAGFLASARNVQWQRSRIDDIGNELTVRATRLSGNDLTVLYAFAISAGTQTIVNGRLSIFLNGAAAQPLAEGFERFSQ